MIVKSDNYDAPPGEVQIKCDYCGVLSIPVRSVEEFFKDSLWAKYSDGTHCCVGCRGMGMLF